MIKSQLHCRNLKLDLHHPRVMGILNLTPDSFYDGGLYRFPDQALFRVEQMLTEGASIIDVGGESTRKGAKPVSSAEEIARVIPTLEIILKRFDAIISIDTQKPAVMREAINLGVHMVNDVNALQNEGAITAVVKSEVAICIMHKQDESKSRQNIVNDVKIFLEERLEVIKKAGIGFARVIIDPGFGFGKTLTDNLTLLRNLTNFADMGVPLLVGLSRKMGKSLGIPQQERLNSSVVLASSAVYKGASIVRSHDIKPTVDALKIITAIMQTGDI